MSVLLRVLLLLLLLVGAVAVMTMHGVDIDRLTLTNWAEERTRWRSRSRDENIEDDIRLGEEVVSECETRPRVCCKTRLRCEVDLTISSTTTVEQEVDSSS